MLCRCHLAPLSATIHTIQATLSQHHTLPNSYKMVRSPHLCSHLFTHRRVMVLLQALCPAHCYHAVQSAHKSLRVPPVMAHVMSCSSLKHCGIPIAPHQPSQLPVPITLLDAAVQTTPPCDVSQEVSTQTSDQQDMLSCDVAVQTSSHDTHISSLDAAAQTTSPSTVSHHVSTQMGSRSASSFSAVRCYMMLPHNYRSRSSSLAVSTRTVLWTAETAINARFTCIAAAAAKTCHRPPCKASYQFQWGFRGLGAPDPQSALPPRPVSRESRSPSVGTSPCAPASSGADHGGYQPAWR